MSDDPTEEMIKKEIAEAVRILKDDGIHVHKTYSRFMESQKGKTEEAETETEDAGEGDPPPAKKDKGIPKPERRGIWWG